MSREIGRAELRRPKSGQCLALVAAGEKGELFRVGGSNRRQPFDRRRNRLVPLDLAKLARAALADAPQGLAQLCRRVLLHDARGAFAADHAAVDRMIAIALDVADAAVLQMDFDAAAAGAHVAGRVFDLVGHLGRGVDDLPWREIGAQPLEKAALLRIPRADNGGVAAAHASSFLFGGADRPPRPAPRGEDRREPAPHPPPETAGDENYMDHAILQHRAEHPGRPGRAGEAGSAQASWQRRIRHLRLAVAIVPSARSGDGFEVRMAGS